MSSLASVFRIVVLPALSSPSKSIRSSRSGEDFSFLTRTRLKSAGQKLSDVEIHQRGKYCFLDKHLSMESRPMTKCKAELKYQKVEKEQKSEEGQD